MKYSVVYSSRTGNTKLLASKLLEVLNKEDCTYFGAPCSDALNVDRIYVGFWTNQGTCDLTIKEFLKDITSQQIFIFGTAGFGGDQTYYDKILQRVINLLPAKENLIGSYLCQGKMPASVREKYENIKKLPGMKSKMENMIHNYDQALSHPDTNDIEEFKKAVALNF